MPRRRIDYPLDDADPGCPHVNIARCPLYVAMHDARLSGATCWPRDNDLQTGCAVAKGADYDQMVARMNVLDFEMVTKCEIAEREDQKTHPPEMPLQARWRWVS